MFVIFVHIIFFSNYDFWREYLTARVILEPPLYVWCRLKDLSVSLLEP